MVEKFSAVNLERARCAVWFDSCYPAIYVRYFHKSIMFMRYFIDIVGNVLLRVRVDEDVYVLYL